ncbi:19382_t:CDS:2 [Entrophospora sp. SA101]|nr:19382_t:CDS:2 [Entrophospora sp. SA101]
MSMIDGNVELKVPEALQSDQHIVLKTWHKQWQFPRSSNRISLSSGIDIKPTI